MENQIGKQNGNSNINTFNLISALHFENNKYNKELEQIYMDSFSKELSDSFYNILNKDYYSKRSIVDFIEKYNTSDTESDARIVNPQLITISKKFMSGRCKIIHFGQETFGWGGEDSNKLGIFNPKLIPSFLMNLYDYYSKKENHKRDKNWCFCDKLMNDYEGLQVIHMNIFLMGYPSPRRGAYADLNYEVNDITKGILRIAQPHICIFHTGGKNGMKEYDNHIRNMIGEFDIDDELKDVDGTLLASKLYFQDSNFNFKAIRTHHLNFHLTSDRWSMINEYIEKEIASFTQKKYNL